MSDYTDKAILKEQMIKYGFTAPDMTVTEFVEDIVPSAEPELQWIPCSERLPKEYGEYRITWTTSASKKRLIGDSEFEVTSEWDAERYRFKGKWLLDEYIKNYPDVNVIAWKPLEEPWEGGEDATD